MDAVERQRYRVVVEFEVDAEDAGHARGEVAGICEIATEDADDPPVAFTAVLQVIRVGPKTRRPKRETTSDAAQATLNDNYRRKAQELYAWYSPDVAIDQDATVSMSDSGAFVAAWVWVPRADLGNQIEQVETESGTDA